MRHAVLVSIAAVCAWGQANGGQADWSRNLRRVTSRPAAQASVSDIDTIQQSALLAAPYLMALQPGDYEANRELFRQAATYLATVELLSNDPRIRQSLGGAYSALAALRWLPMGLMPGTQKPGSPRPQTAPDVPLPPEAPRFSLEAPVIAGADLKVAGDLPDRYELAAAKGETAWRAISALRNRLQAQGLVLNASTETSVARLQVYFDLAFEALKLRDWTAAKLHLERAEHEAEKVIKETGR